MSAPATTPEARVGFILGRFMGMSVVDPLDAVNWATKELLGVLLVECLDAPPLETRIVARPGAVLQRAHDLLEDAVRREEPLPAETLLAVVAGVCAMLQANGAVSHYDERADVQVPVVRRRDVPALTSSKSFRCQRCQTNDHDGRGCPQRRRPRA